MTKQVFQILLFEDDADDTLLIRHTLSRLSMPTVHCQLHNVEKLQNGMAWLKNERADIVLLDLSLPDSRGIQTLETFVAAYPLMPVVVLTGLDSDETALTALRSGAQDYLVKGQFDEKILWRVLRYAIERKQSLVELARLASFPEKDPLPVIEIKFNKVITYANPAARRIFPDLFAQGLQHELLAQLQIVNSDTSGRSLEFLTREVTLGSSVYEIHYSFVPEQHLLRLYVWDITERKRLEQLKDNFVHTVSHELRTPIAILKGSMENLLIGVAGPVTEKQQRILNMANENVKRLERLVSDILDISRLESGKAKMDLRPLDVKILIQHCLESFHVLVKDQHVAFVTNVPETLPLVSADEDMIIQVVVNLLSNALRFAKNEIHINVQEQDNAVRISIIDDGIGIAESDMPKLFNKFEQFNRPQGGKGYKGTGLGLAICKHIVEEHQGRIWAESKPDQGCQFHFTLPRAVLKQDQ